MTVNFVKRWILFVTVLLFSFNAFAKEMPLGAIAVAELPAEAQKTLMLIKQGGPFPYAKGGAIFGNYEKILPQRKRGYYHEFTVKTPGARNRGARRIIVGGDMRMPQDCYYTDNHYATFKRITE